MMYPESWLVTLVVMIMGSDAWANHYDRYSDHHDYF